MEKTLFFDVETTGLPPRNADYRNDYELFPHLVSIAWGFRWGVIKSYIIRPVGYEIPEEVVAIHNITTERALKEGKPLMSVLDEFIHDCLQADTIVGHNIYFDTSIIKANICRAGLLNICDTVVDEALHKTKRVDTMKSTIKFVNAKFADGRGGKWPSLSELYAKLFEGKTFNAHDALADVHALMECTDALVEQGIVALRRYDRPAPEKATQNDTAPASVPANPADNKVGDEF